MGDVEMIKLREKFGELIKVNRKKQRITQDELARKVGVSVTYMREVEHGKYTITWPIWLKICTFLHMDINDIQEKFMNIMCPV